MNRAISNIQVEQETSARDAALGKRVNGQMKTGPGEGHKDNERIHEIYRPSTSQWGFPRKLLTRWELPTTSEGWEEYTEQIAASLDKRFPNEGAGWYPRTLQKVVKAINNGEYTSLGPDGWLLVTLTETFLHSPNTYIVARNETIHQKPLSELRLRIKGIAGVIDLENGNRPHIRVVITHPLRINEKGSLAETGANYYLHLEEIANYSQADIIIAPVEDDFGRMIDVLIPIRPSEEDDKIQEKFYAAAPLTPISYSRVKKGWLNYLHNIAKQVQVESQRRRTSLGFLSIPSRLYFERKPTHREELEKTLIAQLPRAGTRPTIPTVGIFFGELSVLTLSAGIIRTAEWNKENAVRLNPRLDEIYELLVPHNGRLTWRENPEGKVKSAILELRNFDNPT